MSKEIWKPIKGYEGGYEISNLGRIKSLKGGHKILKQFKQNSGYDLIDISKKGEGFTITVHRLVAKHFIQNPDNKPCVNHINGDKCDNSVDNLEWCTHKENYDHAVSSNLVKISGDRRAKLSFEIAEDISDEYKKNPNKSALARKHNVTISSITGIVTNYSYKREKYLN